VKILATASLNQTAIPLGSCSKQLMHHKACHCRLQAACKWLGKPFSTYTAMYSRTRSSSCEPEAQTHLSSIPVANNNTTTLDTYHT
jgi:hypothetical protein